MAARRHPTERAAAAEGAKGAEVPPWFLYVAECADLTLYVGIAKDVGARLEAHNSGRGARYTRTRRPVRLVYTEKLPDIGSALRREREIKRWSRPQKVAKLGLGCRERLRARLKVRRITAPGAGRLRRSRRRRASA